MLCILYVTAVGTLLSVAGVLIERVLPATFPRRWIWCLIIPTSIALPGYYRWHHTWAVRCIAARGAANPGWRPGSGDHAALDPAWWAQVESYDTIINRVWLTASAAAAPCGASRMHGGSRAW